MQRTARRFANAAACLLVFTLAALAGAECIGDCSGDGEVTIDELLLGVNIALGNAQVTACAAVDADNSSSVEINEIVAAVNNALNGCPVPPTPTPTPVITPGICGNHVVDFDLGETCDDGNTVEGDACPADCRIRTCTASGTTHAIDVQFSVPAGVDLAGITVFLRYPDGVVRIPGQANDPAVLNSLTNLPDNAFSTPNDLDYALRVVIFTPDSSAIPVGRLFTVQFDACAGAAAPQASDFRCSVDNAADTNNDSVTTATCSVTVP